MDGRLFYLNFVNYGTGIIVGLMMVVAGLTFGDWLLLPVATSLLVAGTVVTVMLTTLAFQKHRDMRTYEKTARLAWQDGHLSLEGWWTLRALQDALRLDLEDCEALDRDVVEHLPRRGQAS